MANGRVITGYSKPYVAVYSVSDNTVSYASCQALARGVSVSIEPTTGNDNIFYADNVAAESAGGVFSGGTATFVVDGLKDAARKLIMGLPTATSTTITTGTTVDVYTFDDSQSIPYVGVGFIVRYMEGGTTTYVPYVLTKTAFAMEGLEASTQEDAIDFQTTELEATIMRDDSSTHAWLKFGAGQTTEAAAENVVKKLLGATIS